MKIAVFGDIHGNIEALRAAYNAVHINVDKIFHLGDLGGYAPFVNEVADFLIDNRIEGVQGNYDDTVAHKMKHCGCKYEDPVQERMATMSFEWTKGHATSKTKKYMEELPHEVSFTVEDKKVALFHASPLKKNLYWYENRPEKFFKEMSEKVDADILVYGHTHKPYRKDLDGKVFINAGSVGKPKDGDPRACVVVIEITHDSLFAERLREGK